MWRKKLQVGSWFVRKPGAHGSTLPRPTGRWQQEQRGRRRRKISYGHVVQGYG